MLKKSKTYACLDTCDPVTHGVQARLSWVCFDDDFECPFASFEFLLPVDTLGLAEIKHEWFGIHTSVIHGGLRINRHVHPIGIVISRRQVQS